MSDGSQSKDSESAGQDGWPAPPKAEPTSAGGAGWDAPAPASAAGDSAGWPTPAPVPTPDSTVEGIGGDGRPEPAVKIGDASAATTAAQTQPAARGNRAMWIVAGVIVVGLPLGVGIVSFVQPVDIGASQAEAVPATSAPDVEREAGENAADPTWTRPAWADGVAGAVAFELPAENDVRLANGRLRPTLGISCVSDRTDIHVMTGGSAPIDPVTSGHVVKLTFDGATMFEEQWLASNDQRSLLAPRPLELALRIASARTLDFGFTHYMTGSEVVEFDLRGADELVASMAKPCGWTSE